MNIRFFFYFFTYLSMKERILDTWREYENKTEKKKGSASMISHITLAALLAALPVKWNTSSEYSQDLFVGNPIEMKHSDTNAKESIETDKEQLFKNAVAKAIRPINNLKSIPVGGVPLVYNESYEWKMPMSIDFFPKEINVPKLPYTIIVIGEKMFAISPDLWFQVDKMYLDEKSFYVHVTGEVFGIETGKEISKSKESELWEYLAKLYFKWTDVFYIMTTPKEIPKAYQKECIRNLEKINTKK